MTAATPDALANLSREVAAGRPHRLDFQRGWVWDDEHGATVVTGVARPSPLNPDSGRARQTSARARRTDGRCASRRPSMPSEPSRTSSPPSCVPVRSCRFCFPAAAFRSFTDPRLQDRRPAASRTTGSRGHVHPKGCVGPGAVSRLGRRGTNASTSSGSGEGTGRSPGGGKTGSTSGPGAGGTGGIPGGLGGTGKEGAIWSTRCWNGDMLPPTFRLPRFKRRNRATRPTPAPSSRTRR